MSNLLSTASKRRGKRPAIVWLWCLVGILTLESDYVKLVKETAYVADWCCCWSLLYSAILRSRADSLRSHVILPEWLVFIARFWISTEVVYLQRWHGWCHMKLLQSRRVLCTPYNHVPCHFMRSRIRKVHACLAVTCLMHFWQNGPDLLRAAAVTRGWNGHRNKSQHRKLILEKKILSPFQKCRRLLLSGIRNYFSERAAVYRTTS